MRRRGKIGQKRQSEPQRPQRRVRAPGRCGRVAATVAQRHVALPTRCIQNQLAAGARFNGPCGGGFGLRMNQHTYTRTQRRRPRIPCVQASRPRPPQRARPRKALRSKSCPAAPRRAFVLHCARPRGPGPRPLPLETGPLPAAHVSRAPRGRSAASGALREPYRRRLRVAFARAAEPHVSERRRAGGRRPAVTGRLLRPCVWDRLHSRVRAHAVSLSRGVTFSPLLTYRLVRLRISWPGACSGAASARRGPRAPRPAAV